MRSITHSFFIAITMVVVNLICFAVTGFPQELKITLSDWRISAQGDITQLPALFNDGYDMSAWVKATVPGTVFGDHVNAGIEEDPNYGDNIYRVDKKKYYKNFIYRNRFIVPGKLQSEKVWLNFEGINSRGDVYLNNVKLGVLDGFMRRGKYDVTNILKKGAANILVVLVYVPEEPIVNWASPTYLSAGGWDWMPYVPGLNMGITDDVYFTTSGECYH